MIRNDPRMYSAGNVVINQQPHIALYAQLAQHRQARDEAFDEYIRNLNKSVNGAGLRNVDRPIFDKLLQDWQKFGMEHRDEIRNRKGGADLKFMQDYQNLQNIISESKTEEEKKKPLVEMFLDPAKRDRIADSVFDEVHSHDQPLYVQGSDGSIQRNTNRKSLDYNSITFNPKPFEQDKYFKQFEDVKRTDMPPVITTDPKTMTQTEIKKSVYDQEAKDLIATRAVTDLAQNPSFRDMVKKLNKDDYNDFFKDNYGHDIKNEADLAVAYTLKGLQQNVTTTKSSPDTFGRAKEMAGINDQYARRRLAIQDQYIKGRAALRKAKTGQEADHVLNDYINRQYDENKYSHEVISVKNKWQPVRRIYVPTEIRDKYTLSKGNTDEQVPKFFITEDKKYVVPVYPGQSSKKSEPILIETFKGDLGKIWLSRKDATSEMGDELDYGNDDTNDYPDYSTPAASQQDDSYTKEELKANGWNDSQIEKAIKSGKIKVK